MPDEEEKKVFNKSFLKKILLHVLSYITVAILGFVVTTFILVYQNKLKVEQQIIKLEEAKGQIGTIEQYVDEIRMLQIKEKLGELNEKIDGLERR